MAPSIPIWEYSADHPADLIKKIPFVQTFLYSDLASIESGWKRNNLTAFFTFDKKQPGVVPVYRYQAANPQRYQYTSNNTPGFDPGWKFDGTAFYAFMTPESNTVPLYKYSATNPQRERYSTNSSLGNTTWQVNGATFYVSLF